MARYLVTGGAGFIGSHLVRCLLKRKHQVVVLDNLSTGQRSNLHGVLSKVRFIQGDIRDKRIVSRAMRAVQYCLHQAAIPSVPYSMEHPCETHSVNVEGSLNILSCAKESQLKRVVLASSAAVYGAVPNTPKKETLPTHPISPYGLQKRHMEQYACLFYELYGLETICLRYFNVFGPGQKLRSYYASVVPKFIAALLQGKQPVIYGDGKQTRDFTHVSNVVDANMKACVAPCKALGQVYNIGSGQETSVNQLGVCLSAYVQNDICFRYESARPGDIRRSVGDIRKAKRWLGYQPRMDLIHGLEQTLRWYCSKYDGNL